MNYMSLVRSGSTLVKRSSRLRCVICRTYQLERGAMVSEGCTMECGIEFASVFSRRVKEKRKKNEEHKETMAV